MKIDLQNNYNLIVNNIIHHGIKYFKDNNSIKTMILGVSGGIDSALTAMLARRICNELGYLKLIGFWMPISGNELEEENRAFEIGKAVCHEFNVLDLESCYLNTLKTIDNKLYNKLLKESAINTSGKVRMGNIKARLRMINLYNYASKNSGLVLSTDNLTEYYLGFWTLHGDVGDFGFIQQLWKTEIYGIAEAIGDPLESCIDAKPTDGLGITNSDIDQLLPKWKGSYRNGYRVIDNILIDYLNNGKKPDEFNEIIDRKIKTEFKRRVPVSINRDLLTN